MHRCIRSRWRCCLIRTRFTTLRILGIGMIGTSNVLPTPREDSYCRAKSWGGRHLKFEKRGRMGLGVDASAMAAGRGTMRVIA